MLKKAVEVFKENWENIIPVILATPVLVADLIGSEVFPEGTVESMTLAMLLAIAVSQVKSNYGNQLLKKSESALSKMDDLFSMSRGSVSVVKPKDTPHIWKNFRGRLFYYNPPLALAENSNVSEEDMLSGYAKTFSDPELINVTYIFFKDGPKGFYYPNATKYFKKFCQYLEEHNADVLNKLSVVYLEDKQAPSYTFFLGKKGSEGKTGEGESKVTPYSVTYIGEAPFTNNMGVPSLALVSINDQYNDKLEMVIESMLSEEQPIAARDFIKNI